MRFYLETKIMNKLLTTITLLCFSVAANAETYVCAIEIGNKPEITMETFERQGNTFSTNNIPWIINSENENFIMLSAGYARENTEIIRIFGPDGEEKTPSTLYFLDSVIINKEENTMRRNMLIYMENSPDIQDITYDTATCTTIL